MKRTLFALLAATVASFVLTGCPPPIMREVLVYAEDDIPPVITVSSPTNRSAFDSSVTFVGTVVDSAVDEGDGRGRVDSLTYAVVDRESLSGEAEVAADGSFSFTIQTGDLQGNQTVGITATDWNGNSDSVEIEMTDPGVGPDVSIASPQANSVYLSTVVVMGVVNNRGESVAVTEVRSLRYEVLGSSIQGDVDFSATDGAFAFPISTVTLRNRITIRLTATDKNGRTSRGNLELEDRSDGPTLSVSSPAPYSSYQAVVSIAGTVTNNADSASTAEVQSLSYQVLGKTAVTAVPFAAGSGAFALTFTTVGMTGNIIVQLTARDLNNRLTVVDYTLLEDKAGPSIVVDSPLDGTNYGVTTALRGRVRNSDLDQTRFDDVETTSLTYRIGAGDPVPLSIDASGSFSADISTIGKSGTLLLKLSALDLNGHLTEKSITLLDNLPGPVITVTQAPQFYSSLVTTSITVAGTVSAPSNISDNGTAYSVQYGTLTYPGASFAVDPTSGAFSFSFDPRGLRIAGNMSIVLAAIDKGGRKTEKSVSVTDDVLAPYIRAGDTTLATDNLSIIVRLSEPVYSDATGSGALTAADFSAQFAANGGTATAVAITDARRTDGSPLLGGEQEIRLALSCTGTPAGVESVAIRPVDGTSIYDRVGNPLGASESTTPRTLYDQAYPFVRTITAQTLNGVYNQGDPIDILLTFSEVVTVSIAGGAPTVTMETGATDRDATYQSGSGTDTLRFRYFVQDGDVSADLDIVVGGVLTVPSGSSIRDAAGNDTSTDLPGPGGAGSLGNSAYIRIDTAVSAPALPALSAASDTGVPGDDITSNTAPTFAVTVYEAGTITIYRSGTTAIGSAAVGGSGTFDVTSAVLAAGLHTVTARITDLAGNVSDASPGVAVSVDTAASTPDQPALSLSSDTGILHDSVTSDTTPTFSVAVAEPGTIRLYVGATEVGSVSAGAAGMHDVSSSVLAAGPHTFTARLTDLAGNQSASSLGLGVTIDTTPPSVSDVYCSEVSYSFAGNATIRVLVQFNEAVQLPASLALLLQFTSGQTNATRADQPSSTVIALQYTLTDATTYQTTKLDYADMDSHPVQTAYYLVGVVSDAAGNQVTNPVLVAPGAAGSIGAEQTVTVN